MTPNLAGPIQNLQVLRALAAIAVVVFHSILGATFYGYDVVFAGRLQGWGAAGVDVFFVISGFVMVLVQARTGRAASEFLRNRIVRVVPLYWALTLLYILLGLALPSSAFGEQMSGMREAMISLARSLSFSAQYFGAKPALYLGWTLEYEMLFYVVFAAGILLGGGVRRGNLATALVIGALVTFGVIGPVALEFLFGMGLAHFFLAGRVLQDKRLAIALALMAFCISGAATAILTDSPWFRVVFWGAPALMLVTSGLMLPQIGKGLFTLLGDASYSIYLVQRFSLPVTYKALKFFNFTSWGEAIVILVVLITIVLGVILHRMIERPLTACVNNWLPGGRNQPDARLGGKGNELGKVRSL